MVANWAGCLLLILTYCATSLAADETAAEKKRIAELIASAERPKRSRRRIRILVETSGPPCHNKSKPL